MLGGRILIADDEEPLREALRMFLAAKGYDIALAENGLQALEELGRAEYDLLISDVRMPDFSGEELLARLQDTPPEDRPAVIVITGHGTVESAIRGIDVGISAYLRKPLNMAGLETAVRTAIDRRRLARDLKRYYEELDRKVEERTRELTLLNHFSALVNRSFDLDVILDDAVGSIVQSLGSDCAGIYLFEGEPPGLKLKAHRGVSDEFAEAVSVLDQHETYKGLAMHAGPVIVDDVDNVQEPLRQALLREGITTGMNAPIRSGDKLLGLIRVASRSSKEFGDSHLQLLTSLGNNIGVAVEKIRLYDHEKALAEDLQKKVNQLVILNEVGNLAKVSYRLEEASMAVVSAVVQGIRFDKVCLWLLDDKRENLYLAACHGIDRKKTGNTIAVDEGWFTNRHFRDGEAFFASGSICDLKVGDLSDVPEGSGVVLAPLVTRDPLSRDISCWEHFDCTTRSCPAYNSPLSCWMIEDSCMRGSRKPTTLLDKLETCKTCPVYKSNRQGRSIGVLCADNSISGRLISNDEVKVLNVFANSAATIMENIMLMERLIKNERFIDSVIFNMSSGLMVTDLKGHVRMVNFAGADIFRCEQSDLIDRLLTDIFPEAGGLINVEDSSLGREVVVNTKAGPVPVGFTNSYLIGHEGRSDGVIVLFRDLSEIKKLQDQVREGDRFAAIGKVAAGVAHEIRNPLFGITSVAQILAMEVKEGTPQKNLIDAMLSETSRLNTLVEDLLLYGRPMKVLPQPTDINALIESVVEFHNAGILEKRLRVVKDFDPGIPSMLLDTHQMRQVFLNILVNALDASQEAGEITLATKAHAQGVTIRVGDSGVGVPPEDLPKIFDLFYTTKEKGTGLGLAICRKIVEDHGGSISVKSLPGKGTTVELGFPLPKG